MTKFLPTEKGKEELHMKYYKVVDGVDYYVTNVTTAAHVKFHNKYDPRNGKVEFKRTVNKEIETVEVNHAYPEVERVFDGIDLNEYSKFSIDFKELEQLIRVNDAMTSLCKMNGDIPTCHLFAFNSIYFSVGSVDDLEFSYKIEGKNNLPDAIDFTYDPELMSTILKSCKELKKFVSEFQFCYKEGCPLIIFAKDDDYEYYFALAKKLTR